MTRFDEIQQTHDLYDPWIQEIGKHITRLETQQIQWKIRKGIFARMMRIKLSIKIRYARGQLRQMKSDLQRALSRIPENHDNS